MTQELNYEIVPAFDDELNARLNAGIEPAIRRDKTVGELIEEARRAERESIIQRVEQAAASHTGEDRVYVGMMDALEIIKAEGAENEQQSVQAGEAEEAETLGSK